MSRLTGILVLGKMDWARRLLEEHGQENVALLKDPHGGHEEPAWAGQAPHVLKHLFSSADLRERASRPADWEIR